MEFIKPTQNLFEAYQNAYTYFNGVLFNGKLPQCVLNFSRKSKAYGFFAPDRWTETDGIGLEPVTAPPTCHEISINPDTLAHRSRTDVLSTLVHEMVHLQQAQFGTPAKRGYHNREWGTMMEVVGLMPSHTGLPGGRRTGVQMTHYIVEGGKFATLEVGAPYFPYVAAGAGAKKSAVRNKHKYSCGCTNLWGKPGIDVVCRVCGHVFREV